jgi:hypothetical protein
MPGLNAGAMPRNDNDAVSPYEDSFEKIGSVCENANESFSISVDTLGVLALLMSQPLRDFRLLGVAHLNIGEAGVRGLRDLLAHGFGPRGPIWRDVDRGATREQQNERSQAGQSQFLHPTIGVLKVPGFAPALRGHSARWSKNCPRAICRRCIITSDHEAIANGFKVELS